LIRAFSTLLAALFVSSISVSAHAQGATKFIDQELPDALRAPVREFLVRLGVSDVEGALRATRTAERSPGGPSFSILRFEHPADCYKNLCPTVIAEVEHGFIVPQAMLLAEGRVVVGDVIEPFWGSPSVPYMFPSGETMLALRRTSQGWIVGSVINGLPMPDRRRTIPARPPMAPAAPPVPETFDDFQRTLRRLRE
jgi:hypothetical protein